MGTNLSVTAPLVDYRDGLFWATCQYPPNAWPDAMASGLIDALMVALMEQPRVAQILKQGNGGPEPDLVVTLFVGATGRGIWPQKATIRHQGGGLFHVVGPDQDRVNEVAAILTGIFAATGG